MKSLGRNDVRGGPELYPALLADKEDISLFTPEVHESDPSVTLDNDGDERSITLKLVESLAEGAVRTHPGIRQPGRQGSLDMIGIVRFQSGARTSPQIR
ncbi:hypothetical protein PISMIDRAFT_680443 [Pisolithus microcarpus 441]|uniref:Uncharacterized protein n=1 Tax=Pisolithus microcarpus 441 TaxID=765257 RepID=A0A0C9YCB2_9AGAM|nr:hypothetical protein PISMIDRAFT_680443 [Pisolithus microcarpus 441]